GEREPAALVVQQRADGVLADVGRHQVEEGVAVEVGGGEGGGEHVDVDARRRAAAAGGAAGEDGEAALAAGVAALLVGGGEVELAVVVPVAGDDRLGVGAGAGGVEGVGGEGAVALAGEDVDAEAHRGGDREVDFAVAVPVAGDDILRRHAGRV